MTRKELLSVVNFIVHFHQYLLGSTFTLRTDHNALLWLQNFKNPEGQIVCWLEKLQEYSFEIEHRPGHKHNNADADHQLVRQTSPLILYTTSALDLLQTLLRYSKMILSFNEQGVQQPSSDMTAGYSGRCIRLFGTN